jgi:hypothetical protein
MSVSREKDQATGADLDDLAEYRFGMLRIDGETDAEFRKRIQKRAFNFGEGFDGKTEKPYKPRVCHYKIKGIHTFRNVHSVACDLRIARWSKSTGLMWRSEPIRDHGADSLEKYWKISAGSPEAIHKVIVQVGEYLSSGKLEAEPARELLDLLTAALRDKLPK